MADKDLSEKNASLIRNLASLLEETGLSEIEIEEDGVRIRVGRVLNMPSHIVASSPDSALHNAPSSAPISGDSPDSLRGDNLLNHPGIVTSPMVGTAYIASSPESLPFIREGDMVREGAPLLIIEAMKTMNQITAKRDGRIKTILFKNNQPVEFGEPLLIIE